jgi:hypothetical protein
MQRLEQHHGIHAAGDGGENLSPLGKQMPFPHHIFDALKKFAHPDILGLQHEIRNPKEGRREVQLGYSP